MAPLETVFYVDDDKDMCWLMQRVLGKHFNFLTFDSPEVALASVQSEAPDLILLDVIMPGLDGPTLFQKIRNLPGHQTTPIVFMTAQSLPSELDILNALNPLAVFLKPLDIATLPNTIKELLSPSDRA